MADIESPPWLLGVLWFALLVLGFGAVARSGHAGYLHAAAEAEPPAQMAVSWAPLHRSAQAPSSATKRNKLSTPYRKKTTPAPARPSRTEDANVDAVLEDADQFEPATTGRTMQPHRLDPGRRARTFNTKLLPFFTEGALALAVGIMLGFLTRLELIVVIAVSLVFGLGLFYLEWREYTSLPFKGLWDWAWAAVLNPMEGKDTLASVGGKLASVGLATVGFFAGIKG